MFPAHSAALKTLACTNRFLATGAADDVVRIFDIKLRKEIGLLSHHQDDITSLKFHKTSHLVTASEDGTIALIRTSDWELLKILKGHSKGVNSISIHPNGSILLSASKDLTIKTWDLTRGVMVLSTTVLQNCEQVEWSINSLQLETDTPSHFIFKFEKLIEFHPITNSSFVKTYDSKIRLHSIRPFVVNGTPVVFAGSEDGTLTIIDLEANVLKSLKVFEGRVKDIDVCDGRKGGLGVLVACCGSDGKIDIIEFKNKASIIDANGPIEDGKEFEGVVVGEYDAKVRLTCIKLMLDNKSKKK
jgi:protein MAK11